MYRESGGLPQGHHQYPDRSVEFGVPIAHQQEWHLTYDLRQGVGQKVPPLRSTGVSSSRRMNADNSSLEVCGIYFEGDSFTLINTYKDIYIYTFMYIHILYGDIHTFVRIHTYAYIYV